MAENRQRLRPWLEAKIDSGSIPGLHWTDKAHTTFRITWKHGGKQNFDPKNDSVIFKEWAIHTGRYREGIDDEDYATWKTRLRCAFNKASDIQLVRTVNEEEPYREYRLLPKSEIQKPKKSTASERAGSPATAENSQSEVWSHITPVQSPQHPQTGAVPTVVDHMQLTPSELKDYEPPVGPLGVSNPSNQYPVSQPAQASLGSLPQIDSGDLFPQVPGGDIPILATLMQGGGDSHEEAMDISEGTSEEVTQVIMDDAAFPTDAKTGAPATSVAMTVNVPSPMQPPCNASILEEKLQYEPQKHEMLIKTQFRSHALGEYRIQNPNGCRVYYTSSQCNEEEYLERNIAQQLVKDEGEIYGPRDVDPVRFPQCNEGNVRSKKQIELTTALLDCMGRGLILKCVDGNIYAKRLCRSVVFYSNEQTEGSVIKLNRNIDVKIFDYNVFCTAMSKYISLKGPKPKVETQIGFGQKWAPNQDVKDILISAIVVCGHALYMSQKLDCSGRYESGISLESISQLQISNCDDNDNNADIIRNLMEQLRVNGQFQAQA